MAISVTVRNVAPPPLRPTNISITLTHMTKPPINQMTLLRNLRRGSTRSLSRSAQARQSPATAKAIIPIRTPIQQAMEK